MHMSKNYYRVLGLFGVLMLVWSVPGDAAQTCRSDDQIPKTTPSSQFSINGDGTVTDNKTGLMWKRCSEGQSGSDCGTGTISTMTWKAVLEAAQNSTFAGHSDWRLPNIKELRSIVEEQCSSPAINVTIFPNTPSSFFWSASPYVANSYGAWYVNFYRGHSGNGGRSSSHERVRLVRSGQ